MPAMAVCRMSRSGVTLGLGPCSPVVTFVPGITSSATEGRLFVLDGSSLFVRQDGGGVQIPKGLAPSRSVYLGDQDGTPCFAWLKGDAAEEPTGTQPVQLRRLFGAMTEEDFGIAGRAMGLTAWDRDHRFCGRCGSPTERSQRERVRTCERCGHGAYPRLSPAVIVLVERDGRALLGRGVRFPLPFFSTLAGFVEVGESLEQAVIREIKEEVGIDVEGIRYFGSQPWPLTDSLMVGFTACWARGEIACDPDEIAEADWYAADALPRVPPKLSIARQLIDDFVRRHEK